MKSLKKGLGIVLGLLAMVSQSAEATNVAHATAVSEWLLLQKEARQAYVVGVIDGWSSASTAMRVPFSPETKWDKRMSCLVRLKPDQALAAVEAYVREHPGAGGLDVSTVVTIALSPMCP